MKSSLYLPRRECIPWRLEMSMIGFSVLLILNSVVTVLHSGLLMME